MQNSHRAERSAAVKGDNALKGVQRFLFSGNRLPKPLAVLIVYSMLCGGLGVLLIHYRIDASLLLLAGGLILVAAIYYARWLSFTMLAVLSATAAWVSYINATDLFGSLISIFLATVIAIFALSLVAWSTGRYLTVNERFHIVADRTHFFEYWKRPDGSFGYISPTCKQISGYGAAEFLQNPQLFQEIIHPEDRKDLLGHCGKIRNQGEETRPITFRILHRNGQVRWLEHICSSVYNENGIYLGIRASNRDVTSQIQAERHQKSNIERLTLALEGTEDGVWDMDLTTGIVYLSPSYARSLGFDPEKPYVRLQELHSLTHPDDLQAMLDAFKAHLRGKSPAYRAEYRVRTPRGEWRWVLDRGRVTQQDRNGKPIRMIGTHVDIDERKKIEEALQQSERKFRQLAENMREVFWLQDRDTQNFIYISPAFAEVWGRSCDSLYQNPNSFIESVHKEDLGWVFHSYQQLIETGKIFNEEYRIFQPDGTVRWVWVRAYPIYDAGETYYRIAGVAEDITERKKAEAALKESEKRYRDLIEHQGGGVSIIDPHETVVFMNPAGEDIFGVPRGTLASRNLREFLEDDQLSFFQGQSALRRQGVESSFEIIITRPDKEKRSLLVTATPRFDVNGQFLGTIVIFRDITQRKEREDKLRYISMHDALTGLHNRAFYEDEITRLDQGSQYPISVIMIDVDGLKLVNDQFGHSAGDELLIHVGNILKHSLRTGDIIARIGGDEFAILMPNTEDKALEQVLSRISENIIAENEKDNDQFVISISAGGFTCHQKGLLRDAINQADVRMYQIKDQKKNKYFFKLPVTPEK